MSRYRMVVWYRMVFLIIEIRSQLFIESVVKLAAKEEIEAGAKLNSKSGHLHIVSLRCSHDLSNRNL
uniref:Uncharacterized protein n=1 Tax=Megaselia scalaris TaxID=36166 RepID=T1H4U7_MEGSC